MLLLLGSFLACGFSPAAPYPLLHSVARVSAAGPVLSADDANGGKAMTGYQQWLSRLKTSYMEGYTKPRRRFSAREDLREAGSLSQGEKIAGGILTLTLVEVSMMGAGILGAWLCLGAPAGPGRHV